VAYAGACALKMTIRLFGHPCPSSYGKLPPDEHWARISSLPGCDRQTLSPRCYYAPDSAMMMPIDNGVSRLLRIA